MTVASTLTTWVEILMVCSFLPGGGGGGCCPSCSAPFCTSVFFCGLVSAGLRPPFVLGRPRGGMGGGRRHGAPNKTAATRGALDNLVDKNLPPQMRESA